MSSLIPTDPTTITGLIAVALSTSPAVRASTAKLIDTVRDFAGWGFEPRRIRDMADAESYARIKATETNVEIQRVKDEGQFERRERKLRAADRIAWTQERQQSNIESIILSAERELPDTISEIPVDPDWTAQFFDGCKNVGDEEMRRIWAKLLAGEVASPGSFSLLTLSTVRVMSKHHADLFTRLGSLVWSYYDCQITFNPFVHGWDARQPEVSAGLDLDDLLKLQSLGLISFSETGFQVSLEPNNPYEMTYFGTRHTISNTGFRNLLTGHVLFTESGRELFLVAGSVPSESHRKNIISRLADSGWSVDDGTESYTATRMQARPVN